MPSQIEELGDTDSDEKGVEHEEVVASLSSRPGRRIQLMMSKVSLIFFDLKHLLKPFLEYRPIRSNLGEI